ncbi:hypothetical protein [Pseudomarimonas salicorniae]|uniref:Uncharacterized protein n=1 Tax=Pseudomarimonas salicorniae TaxID=2933270 RepID=A0ABT0GDG2_9GAMM|nr:hypothetical protein [Lysobacter sp. CAU 1642]MCK7592580.1 hypothetical protein [Lysobacter sp. CAU 1642]
MRPSRLSLALCAALAPTLAMAGGGHLEQWKEYAGANMAPDFDWYRPAAVALPSVLPEQPGAEALAGWTVRGVALRVSSLDADLGWASDAATAVPRSNAFSVDGDLSGRAISSQYSGTRLGLRSAGFGEFGISAVVARQHYATQGFGYGEWDGSYNHRRFLGIGGGVHESSTGNAVRVDWRNALGDGGWLVDAAVQSRIEMDPFKAYRGVYSEAGDFDIPGYARLALEAPVGARLSLVGEVQRVFYREIPTFTSASLPTRFLALLGDGASPDFAWRDLTVFAVEARLRDDFRGQWSLRLATQQQPRPTSQLLDRALEELYSDQNISVAYLRDSQRWGQLRVGASYSPVTYFLGSAPYLQRGFQTGRQLEFEAQWTLPF